MESILTSIKKMLGPSMEDDYFDPDIIMHINTVFFTLKQLGVGPAEGFFIEDASTTWSEYIENPIEHNAVKSYMYAKVKLIFDPPQNSAHIKCLENTVSEFEWRLNHEVELPS